MTQNNLLRDLPSRAQRLELPSGRVLQDAVIWPGFCQVELGLDPHALWRELLGIPTWPNDSPIPFRHHGEQAHWIQGSHRALRYRGHELRRHKIWCQSDYAMGLRRYGYTGWQHAISYATHAVEHVAPVHRLAHRLNEHLVGSGNQPHNHWIVTRYDDESHHIGYHSDKDKDFAPSSFFVVIKFGAPRRFAFRLPPQQRQDNPAPFYDEVLEAGTAIFVRTKARGAANDLVQHGVPEMKQAVGVSGSIVSRCIKTCIPWEEVRRNVERRVVARGFNVGTASR